jgi:hypothetical protein
MTIYEIKQRVKDQPYFFTRDTMKFFHQTLRDFRVYSIGNNQFKLVAPMRDYTGKQVGETVRVFDATTDTFVSGAA